VTDDSLPELRASDADREHRAEVLRRAAGEGRLTMDELEERLNTVYESRTHRELERLVADVVVRGEQHHPATKTQRMPVRRGEGGANRLVSIMRGRERKGRWRVGTNLKVNNIMGGSDLDLNDAELAADEVHMTVFALMGGAEIRVPGRHRRQTRAQALARRAQAPEASRAWALRPPGARAPAGRAAP
jgi:hypothetical protein